MSAATELAADDDDDGYTVETIQCESCRAVSTFRYARDVFRSDGSGFAKVVHRRACPNR